MSRQERIRMVNKEYFSEMIKDSMLDCSKVYRHDEKMDSIMFACCTALWWIAEELHEFNERSKDG